MIGEQPEIPTNAYHSPYDQDWRVLGGLAVTVVYLILMAIYISGQVGWTAFTVTSQ